MESTVIQPPQATATPSPDMELTQLKDCMEELLKFTLTCSIQGEVDLGLSKDYCSRLLQDDPSSPFQSSTDIFKGVPSYALYKHLAASLYQTISSGGLVRVSNKISFMHQEESLKLKEDEWTKLILERGLELLHVLKSVDFELHVQEPYFSQLKGGCKTVEGRCASGNNIDFHQQAHILEQVEPPSLKPFHMIGRSVVKSTVLDGIVKDVHRYASFIEMLQMEGLERVVPGVTTFEEGVQVYRNFYSEEKERINGVLAICVTKFTRPLHNFMASILSGLGYVGIQRMLNMVHTVGTIPEALPPPTSALISSFLAPHNAHVKGSVLTDGARALAKHVNRSSDNYWGEFYGSDSDKNQAAFDVISRFIVNCCWMNMHVVPPNGTVFEIRVAEGFGARWSEDGSKFIGFLEPYMFDGHSKGWKH